VYVSGMSVVRLTWVHVMYTQYLPLFDLFWCMTVGYTRVWPMVVQMSLWRANCSTRITL